MMSYKEMAENVLEARDRHEEKKRRRKTVMLRCIPAAALICLAVIMSEAIVRRPMTEIPQPHDIITETERAAIPAGETDTSAAETNSERITEPELSTETAPETSYTGTKTETAEKSAPPVTSAQESRERVTAAAADNSEAAGTEAVSQTEAMTGVPSPEEVTSMPVQTSAEAASTKSETEAADHAVTSSSAAAATHSAGQAGGAAAPAVVLWEDKPPYEQYTYGRLGDILYKSWMYSIPEDMTGELLGSMEMEGYDSEKNVINNCTAYAYTVNGYTPGEAAAVRFTEGGELYFYAGPDRTSESVQSLINELRRRKDEKNEN